MRIVIATLALTLAGCGTSVASIDNGTVAPGFTLKDLNGTEVSLSSFKGKTVVLEWFNPGCPYVKHAHGEGGVLQKLAAETVSDDVVWLGINSGAPGKQGHGIAVNQKAAADWGMTHPMLIDEDGSVGKAYGAKTTPHMYVIDPEGKLRYQGAIDNQPMGKGSGSPVNYVTKALEELSGGEVTTASTKPYGCSVKY